MTVLVYLGAGVAVLVMLVLALARHSDDPEPSGLPSRAVMDRALAGEDAAFIARLHDGRLERLFAAERRRLTLAWLRQTRGEAGRLHRAHAHGVRQTGDLRPITEIRIAGEFALFVLVCAALAALVRLSGPFRTRAFLRLLELGVGALETLGNRMAAGAGMAQEAGAS
jgi:hypothetical protein